MLITFVLVLIINVTVIIIEGSNQLLVAKSKI
jgi:hypothetical protein